MVGGEAGLFLVGQFLWALPEGPNLHRFFNSSLLYKMELEAEFPDKISLLNDFHRNQILLCHNEVGSTKNCLYLVKSDLPGDEWTYEDNDIQTGTVALYKFYFNSLVLTKIKDFDLQHDIHELLIMNTTTPKGLILKVRKSAIYNQEIEFTYKRNFTLINLTINCPKLFRRATTKINIDKTRQIDIECDILRKLTEEEAVEMVKTIPNISNLNSNVKTNIASYLGKDLDENQMNSLFSRRRRSGGKKRRTRKTTRKRQSRKRALK